VCEHEIKFRANNNNPLRQLAAPAGASFSLPHTSNNRNIFRVTEGEGGVFLLFFGQKEPLAKRYGSQIN